MIHYVEGIKSQGSADGFNTEWSEQLHIDFAKDATERFRAYLDWLLRREELDNLESDDEEIGDSFEGTSHGSDIDPMVDDINDDEPTSNNNLPITHHLPVKPSFPLVNLEDIVNHFHATDFLPALTTFIQRHFPPPQQPILPNPTDRFDTFKHLSIHLHNLPATGCSNILQRIRAVPLIPGPRKDSAASFDIVLVRAEGEARNEVTKGTYLEGAATFILHKHCLRVAQVRMFFALPDHLRHNHSIPKFLAYIKWFNPLQAPDPDSGLYSVTRSSTRGRPVAEIIPICDLVSSCYLIPKLSTLICPRFMRIRTFASI
ncbi:uncharacterized protein LACBIDRAFT_329089 [Laccaria bicolor S238N-H82]|uniref:Predicted protein n=1 Tax=Laccaria bicolor (strain S238N-H82 / ATCC MYA-4686) TaxID=486041 RepID=B0DH07_LACBS|nr:uncharacterized protein LACBIDRAFT_329089 [Laccaria bicolor S238N-H82]EDR06364.1 predicted protein [Laccaria bicolor S238N-H82]|eukprot:XP_001883225.1 predicted protein [Laccaria bicolor S238N-H82]